MTSRNEFINKLTPTQEHFLKKFLLEKRLEKELTFLSDPDSLRLFGEPFKRHGKDDNNLFPMLRFFFNNFVGNFPFITNNTPENQRAFWQDTVQSFVESLNSKQLSNSKDRKEHVTKRRQANFKVVGGLLLFYNSMIVTDKDMEYLQSDHLKPSDVGKLDKIKAYQTPNLEDVSNLQQEAKFTNEFNTNIVGVNVIHRTSSSWIIFSEETHHYEFIIQVTHSKRGKHYVNRPYHKFKELERQLKSKFPGIMSTEMRRLPEKFKHDANNLVKEKLRLALRGYLNQLLKFPDIVETEEFQQFLNMDSFDELSETQQEDYDQRSKHEKLVIATQIEFQKQVSVLMLDLTKNFDEFKSQLISNPKVLERIFEEIGSKPDLTDLSPLLKVFIDWCKIELSATIFQIFFSQDNSNEMLNNLVKFHRLFPYGLVYNILRFTNPMSMVSSMINLLLATLPGTKKSLMSIIFIMLLDDDLSGYEKEINEVKIQLSNYPNFVNGVEQFVADKIELDLEVEDIIETAITQANASTPMEKAYLKDKSKNSDIFTNLKQLYHLKIRQNDKLVLKSLWEEPEVTRLLKQFLIIFYQPLMKLMSKSKLHLFFKGYQKFVDELAVLLVSLNEEEIYYLSPAEIFNKLMKVVDNNIVIFWSFVHNMYNNDEEQLFLKIIKWIENFLVMLRLKFVDIDKVKITIEADMDINEELFFEQLTAKMNKTILKRQLFKDYYNNNIKKTSKDTVASNWDQLHDNLNQYDEKFGLNGDDLEEFNFDVRKTDVEFQKQINELTELTCDTSELEKFDSNLVVELNRILSAL